MPTIAVHSKHRQSNPSNRLLYLKPHPLSRSLLFQTIIIIISGLFCRGRAGLRADPRWRLKQRGNQLRRSLTKNKRHLLRRKEFSNIRTAKRCGYAPLRWPNPPPTAKRAKEETARAGKRLQERNLTGAFCCQPAKLKPRYTYLPYLHTFWPLIR